MVLVIKNFVTILSAIFLSCCIFGCTDSNFSAQYKDHPLDSNLPSLSQDSTEFVLGSSVNSSENVREATLIRVVDGDTLWVNLDGEKTKVRLIGIDAPESVHSDETKNTPEGIEASDYVKSILYEGQTLWLQKDVSDCDSYGRSLFYVWLELPNDFNDFEEASCNMLNAIIVRNGYAKSYVYDPDVRYVKLFDSLQKEAAAASLGVSYLWQ